MNPSATKRVSYFNQLEKPILFIGLLLMIAIINYQTLFRYVLSAVSIFISNAENSELISRFIEPAELVKWVRDKAGWATWTEELARYIFIWVSYLAVPLAILNNDSIRIDILHHSLTKKNQSILWVTIHALSLILIISIFSMGLEHLAMQFTYPQTTPSLKISYAIPYLILPIGFGLMAIRSFQCLYRIKKELSFLQFFYGLLIAAILTAPVFLLKHSPASAVMFGYFFVLIAIGLPIAFALGLASVFTILNTDALPLDYIAQISFVSIDSFPIMAIPFFIAAGIFMGAGGLSERLLSVADKIVGAKPGGLALASIMTCMFFSAISGSGPATVAAIGSITIPAMTKRGYNTYFSVAVVACAGAIGVIIPPSNPFVVYGVSAQASIGKLFIAGIIPGIIMGAALMTVAYYISKKNNWRGTADDRSFKATMYAIYDAKWALLVPVIILGGIYGGIMTPTESAAVAALYGLIIGLFVYKELNMSNLWDSVINTANTSSVIIVLMAMASIFGNLMTIESIPETIATYVLSLTENKYLILLLINVLLLIIGVFMEALAAIVIITPVLLPLALQLGIDPIHFGVIMVVSLAIGFVTPPVGVNLFVASSIAKVDIEGISKAAIPFIIVMIIVLMLITYIPVLSLGLI